MGLLHAASLLLALASTTLSFPTSGSQDVRKNSVVVESLSAPPRGWVKNETQQVDKEAAQIRLRMHLVHQDMDKFHELAMNVCSDPPTCFLKQCIFLTSTTSDRNTRPPPVWLSHVTEGHRRHHRPKG